MIYIISTKYTQLIFSLVVDNLLKDAVYCINIYIPYNNEDEYFLYILLRTTVRIYKRSEIMGSYFAAMECKTN